MTISCLDSRYSDRIKEILPYLGEEAFVYYMSAWSVTYAECTNNDTYLPPYANRDDLYERVSRKEASTKHQMTALIQVLEEDFPNVQFHFGLTSEDIMHNARTTQMFLIINEIYKKLRDLDAAIKMVEKDVKFPILAHTHGQPATPVMLGPYLRAKIRNISLVRPQFRLGGSNGQLTALRYASGIKDFSSLTAMWSKRIKEKLPELMDDVVIDTPSKKVGLLQIGPHNDATFLSGMGLAVKLRALSRALWDHAQRRILVISTGLSQTGSSAMPHKINPIDFENAEGNFSIAYQMLTLAFEANSDTRGLRDLSNSIINRQVLESWAYMFLGIKSLIKGLHSSQYDPDKIMAELRNNPDCLTEIYRYYLMMEEGHADPYWELKNNPPKDFDEALARMPNWSFDWPSGR